MILFKQLIYLRLEGQLFAAEEVPQRVLRQPRGVQVVEGLVGRQDLALCVAVEVDFRIFCVAKIKE